MKKQFWVATIIPVMGSADKKPFFFFQNYVHVQSAKNKGEYSTMKLSF